MRNLLRVRQERTGVAVIVMPSNASGWFWHCLARETGRIGHLYSPGAQRGPWPWFPYALDNGAFSCWDMDSNTFSEIKWAGIEPEWKRLLLWCQCANIKPMWAIVPDVPGNSVATVDRWSRFALTVQNAGIPLAVAVQDGMDADTVRRLNPTPSVVAVGGTTEWKWGTVEMWCAEFPRVHLLRCNSPEKVRFLDSIGCESTDGTGWNRGDVTQTRGLEEWARENPKPNFPSIYSFACKQPRRGQIAFA